LAGLSLSNPYTQFLDQGRNTITRQIIDNATWSHGKHNVSFGYNYNRSSSQTFNYSNTEESLTFGFSTLAAYNNYNVTAKSLGNTTSMTTASLGNLNALAAFLSGTISGASINYNASSATSGYLQGTAWSPSYILATYAPYVQDQWHVLSNLSVTLGLKYEYWAPVRENHGLYWMPDQTMASTAASLLNPNGTVSYHKQAYNPDYKQFAPNAGFAWDPFKNGKTSVRGGYSLSYVNDDFVTALNNVLIGNNYGPTVSPSLVNLGSNITTGGIPTIAAPTQLSSTSYLNQLKASPTSAAWAIDKNIRTPYVHQIDFEVQREIGWNTGVTARYVGTMARDLWQGVDLNQQKVTSNSDYMKAFANARDNMINNGNPLVGKDVSYITKNIELQGNLTSSTAMTYLAYDRPADLVNYWVGNRSYFASAPGIFLPNPNIYVADEMVNAAVVNYHAVQIEVVHRNKGGLQFQSNFTFGKNLTDSRVDGSDAQSQSHFQPYTDNNNRHYDYSRSSADIRKVWNTNVIYQLPFGHDKRFLASSKGLVDALVSGWTVSSIVRVQSGTPFSIVSAFGTVNRSGRSAYNGAYTKLSHSQIQKMIGVRKVGNSYYWIDPKVLDSNDGTATGYYDNNVDYADENYTPVFSGQVFFNPVAGQLGNLRRYEFNGPMAFSLDASFAKNTKLTKRSSLEFRVDIFNLFNRLNWVMNGDFNINSQTFGQISTGNTISPRVVQASLKLSF